MKLGKLLFLFILLAATGAFIYLDLGQYLSLESIKLQQQQLDLWYQNHTLLMIAGYFLVYVLVTGLSLPGATVLTLLGGAIFGLINGVIIISFASTIGATTAFLVSRYLLRDWVQLRFGQKLATINNGIEKDGAFYLFALRLVPAFPFFMINLLMGLTPIRVWTYFWVSQIGMLAGTIVYVYAGTQLAELESLSGILSPDILIAFTLLGIFPLIARKLLDAMKANKVYRGWKKPHQFDTNLVVIGAGAAGLVSAYIAAAIKAKVTLIEKNRMGGDCLYTGCVPSKSLLRSAKFMSQLLRCKDYGIAKTEVTFNFADVMERVQQKIKQIEPHDSVERYTRLGVDCVQGEATITSPWTVEVNGETINTRSIIIAAGSEPYVPDIAGIEDIEYFTSDTIWNLRHLPQKLIVIGGGPIGCELAQAFRRFSSQVTLIQRGERLLPQEDAEASHAVAARFTHEGMQVCTQHTPLRFEGNTLVCEHKNAEHQFEFDAILFAVGRKANTDGYGLENLNINLNNKQTIDTNEFLQTRFPNIYACGDVAGPYQFTHVASHQAWYAAVNSLLGFKKFKADYSVIPWATFTDPEVARVGLNEQQARQQNIEYEVVTYGIDDLDRAIADSENHGFIKVLTEPGKDRILGVTIVGEHAGEIISEFILAMRHGLGLNKILGTIHIYPTYSEANKYAAGNWKKAHAPETLLKWAERFHRWRRG